MPLIQVTLIEGRSAEAKSRLIHQLTEAAIEAIAAPRESIRVILQEVPPAHWGVGGVAKSATQPVKEASHG